MKNKNIEKIDFLKIVYFDEAAAQDYVDVTNGGRLDWSTQENKEKIAKIVAEIEAHAKSGFNILNYIKATFQGKVDANASAELTSAFDKTIKNTLLSHLWHRCLFPYTVCLYINCFKLIQLQSKNCGIAGCFLEK